MPYRRDVDLSFYSTPALIHEYKFLVEVIESFHLRDRQELSVVMLVELALAEWEELGKRGCFLPHLYGNESS